MRGQIPRTSAVGKSSTRAASTTAIDAWRFGGTSVAHLPGVTVDEATPRPRVLLVEDDREMRTLLAQHLRRNGYEVTESCDGFTALARLGDAISRCGRSSFDALVSDVRIPGHSGFDLLGVLRRYNWAMPVVLITAFGNNELHDEARRLGAKMLDKPFDFDVLTAALEQLVA